MIAKFLERIYSFTHMWRFLLVLLAACLLIGCGSNDSGIRLQNNHELNGLAYQFDGIHTPTPVVTNEDVYFGKTIDQIFPVQFERSFGDQGNNIDFATALLDEFELKTRGFSPISLSQNKKEIFRFTPKSPDDYWSNLAGTASLLGQQSKQIYVVATGPGGVCCTNYWIIDVSTNKPRLIFDSESNGRFRDAMEIFDADNDGVYELVQFDSCFRYFMEECGTCTPEPRVVFKYDSRYQKYIPASGLIQDFVKAGMATAEMQIMEKYEAWKNGQDDSLKFDLHGSVLDHAVQLMHFGKEKEGWRFLKTYDPLYDQKLKKEILWRVKDCPFFNNLRKIN